MYLFIIVVCLIVLGIDLNKEMAKSELINTNTGSTEIMISAYNDSLLGGDKSLELLPLALLKIEIPKQQTPMPKVLPKIKVPAQKSKPIPKTKIVAPKHKDPFEPLFRELSPINCGAIKQCQVSRYRKSLPKTGW